jgi:hypothetical protein
MQKKKPKMQQSWRDSMVKPGVKYPDKPKYDTKIYGTPNLDNWDHVTKKEEPKV